MNIVIEIYMIICVMLLLFDLVFLIVKNKKISSVRPKNTAFESTISRELEQHHRTGAFSENFVRTLPKKLSKTKNMISLLSLVEDNPEEKELFRSYIFDQFDAYVKKSNYEQAYYAHVISKYDYTRSRVPSDFAAKFMQFLDSSSLYTFVNTMNALYAFGEDYLLLGSFEKIEERSGFYHKKLFVDGLLTAKVDFEVFCQKILAHFDLYSPFLQDCLLDYFRMVGFDASELCLRLIKDPQADTQVQYTAMRYFAKYPNEEAKELFLGMLDAPDDQWLRQMLAIQSLSNYQDAPVREAIKSKVTSPNWYVRTNAVRALYQNRIDKSEVFELLLLMDRYTTDALLYQFRNDEEMSHYITDTVQSLALQTAEAGSGHAKNAALAGAGV